MAWLMDMMVGSCEDARAQLSEYLEGELSRPRALRLRLHLAGCDACSAIARSLRATVDRLQELDEAFAPPPSPSIAPAVVERISRLERE